MTPDCPYCQNHIFLPELRTFVVKSGSFFRISDRTRQQRFKCLSCERTFSTASSHPCFNQRKRQINSKVFECLVSGVSQRRLARILQVNRKTIVRKFLFYEAWAKFFFQLHRSSYPVSNKIEFDDLETFEHSKLKPLSVTLAVESGSRRILGFKVAQMPAKGLLVQRSLQKYGKRKDERRTKRQELFAELKSSIHPKALIKSDENPHYPSDVRKFFPKATHETTLGRRGCVTGQGELKAGGFDPLFSLNHTCAMLRANINRLFRQTWCTTKKARRLQTHLTLYCLYHNLALIE